MFHADWSWAEADELPDEAWSLIIHNRELCYRSPAGSTDPVEEGSPLIPMHEIADIIPAAGIVRLGLYRERPLFIFSTETIPTDLKPFQLRPLLGKLPEALLNAILLGYHLLIWLESSAFCGRCGAANQFHHHEKARHCPECGQITFPRISPAVITAVVKENRILLAYNKRFTTPVYSVLAGFVEAGESLEETVAREIREEVGIEVTNIRYFSSQPWPFPDSLMIGFIADWESGEIEPDGIEIADAGWYSPDDLPRLPGKGSIALKIIEHLLETRLSEG